MNAVNCDRLEGRISLQAIKSSIFCLKSFKEDNEARTQQLTHLEKHHENVQNELAAAQQKYEKNVNERVASKASTGYGGSGVGSSSLGMGRALSFHEADPITAAKEGQFDEHSGSKPQKKKTLRGRL